MDISETVLSKGVFVLSLDTELCWGVVDKPEQLKNNLKYYEQARNCIEKILKLLEKYNISATWAIVGHLFLQECNSIAGQKHIDIPRSDYTWYVKDWFNESPCTNDMEEPLWYGQDIIQKIMDCGVYQEIGCHSFAHIPFGDKNTKSDTVKADLSNCVYEAEKLGLKHRSFAFPRNDIGFIDELKNFGFIAYRGTEPSWYKDFPKKIRKVCHILDQFLTITPPVSIPKLEKGLYNIPASMFYLPMNGFRSLIPVSSRIHKAKKGIKRAIRDKKVFHLWFHPFNIATNQEKLLYGLEEIFKEVHDRRVSGELVTKNMDEVVDLMNICCKK